MLNDCMSSCTLPRVSCFPAINAVKICATVYVVRALILVAFNPPLDDDGFVVVRSKFDFDLRHILSVLDEICGRRRATKHFGFKSQTNTNGRNNGRFPRSIWADNEIQVWAWVKLSRSIRHEILEGYPQDGSLSVSSVQYLDLP